MPELKDLGYANGWSVTPPEVVRCQELRDAGEVHDRFSGPGGYNCCHEYGCRTCGFVYKEDSSG